MDSSDLSLQNQICPRKWVAETEQKSLNRSILSTSLREKELQKELWLMEARDSCWGGGGLHHVAPTAVLTYVDVSRFRFQPLCAIGTSIWPGQEMKVTAEEELRVELEELKAKLAEKDAKSEEKDVTIRAS